METIKGAYTSAQIFTTNNNETAIDQYALAQLQMICDQEASTGCRIRVIYSSCISKDTLDEAPFAYRAIEDITEVIGDTVTIDNIIRPVYNFKAGGN